ncbi:hypothetical protein FQZ97_820380 [compost metagenome]
MPLVAVAPAHAVQVGPGALAAPLEGPVVHEFTRQRVVAITQRLGLQRPDHLRVAVVATFSHVDVAPDNLQRGVGLETLHRLGGGFLEEQWNDLHQSTHRDHQHDEHDHQEVVGLDPLVGETLDFVLVGHGVVLRREQG